MYTNSKYLFTSKAMVDEFVRTGRIDNEVRKFWKFLLSQLPKHLQEEIRQKQTSIGPTREDELYVDKFMPYKFWVKGASEELKVAMEDYIIWVEVK